MSNCTADAAFGRVVYARSVVSATLESEEVTIATVCNGDPCASA